MSRIIRSVSARWRVAAVGAAVAVALVVGVLLVRAEPVPRTFAYQGVLTDDAGNPITGDHSITIRVFADATTATALCAETEVTTVTNGLFRVVVGDGGCTVNPVWFALTAPVYLGITVDTTTLSPRVPLFPVASAYQAEHAESADRLVVRYGTKEISVGGTYCASSTAVTGSVGGHGAVKTMCESACGDPAAHLCSSEEVMRSQQLGIDVPTGQRYGTGDAAGGAGSTTDCVGWRDIVSGSGAAAYALRYEAGYGGNVYTTTDCTTGRAFLCCL